MPLTEKALTALADRTAQSIRGYSLPRTIDQVRSAQLDPKICEDVYALINGLKTLQHDQLAGRIESAIQDLQEALGEYWAALINHRELFDSSTCRDLMQSEIRFGNARGALVGALRFKAESVYLWWSWGSVYPQDPTANLDERFYFYKVASEDIAAPICRMFGAEHGDELRFGYTAGEALDAGEIALANASIAKYRGGEVTGEDADFFMKATDWEIHLPGDARSEALTEEAAGCEGHSAISGGQSRAASPPRGRDAGPDPDKIKEAFEVFGRALAISRKPFSDVSRDELLFVANEWYNFCDEACTHCFDRWPEAGCEEVSRFLAKALEVYGICSTEFSDTSSGVNIKISDAVHDSWTDEEQVVSGIYREMCKADMFLERLRLRAEADGSPRADGTDNRTGSTDYAIDSRGLVADEKLWVHADVLTMTLDQVQAVLVAWDQEVSRLASSGVLIFEAEDGSFLRWMKDGCPKEGRQPATIAEMLMQQVYLIAKTLGEDPTPMWDYTMTMVAGGDRDDAGGLRDAGIRALDSLGAKQELLRQKLSLLGRNPDECIFNEAVSLAPSAQLPSTAPSGETPSTGDLVGPMLTEEGSGQTIADIERQIRKLARTDRSILLLGETGTGKEFYAGKIQQASRRKDRSFVVVNCATLPKERIDSELFGHVKGSFTGAIKDYLGKIRQAEDGTVFLDEIGELPDECWGNLLRFLQAKVIHPVGGKDQAVDVRVLAATNRPDKVRRDALYRFDHVLRLPPLRARRDDIPALAKRFFEAAMKDRAKLTQLRLRQKDLDDLSRADYDWPGNIRQLEKAIRRAVDLHDTGRNLTSGEVLDAATFLADLT